MSRVVVCGSLNMDVVVQSARRPATGETLLGATVSFLPGGKGLNQAVAAARLGVPTAMIGTVGNDAFANSLRGFLADCDVDSSGVREIDGPATGVAIIQVAGKDNAITVASGANLHFKAQMVRQEPRADEVWVAQFETPIAETRAILTRARAAGARTVLNLAPFLPFPDNLLKRVDVAVLNEIELSQATRTPLRATSALRHVVAACEKLRAKGARAVVATLGEPRRRGRHGRRRHRHSRLSRPRSWTRPAPAIASSAPWPPAWPRAPRRSRRRAMPARRPPVPSSGWAPRRRCRRRGKLRRGWRKPKSPQWSKNSSGRTPISRTRTPR